MNCNWSSHPETTNRSKICFDLCDLDLWPLTLTFCMVIVFISPLHRRWNGGILDSPRCLSVHLSVRPSVCNQEFRDILKKLLAQFISYLAFTLMGWVSWPLYIFVFLASFLALWWPNIWQKWGFRNFLKKLLPQFSVFLKNSHMCSTGLQNKNLYWIFLDEVGSDQSGRILSPFMGTACCHWLLLLKISWWYNKRNVVSGKNCARERDNGLFGSKSFLISSWSNHLKSYISHEWTRPRTCPDVHPNHVKPRYKKNLII